MAVILSMTYQKKLGLPNFSSHSCSVSLTVEIPDVSQAAEESSKLYQLLQAAVDQEIQQVGFMPDATVYGMNKPANGNGTNGHHANGNGNGNGANGHSGNRNGSNGRVASRNGDAWNCTEGQRGFILRLVNESKLNKQDVEDLAQQLFSAGVTDLDKMQASQLIEELLEKTGKKSNGRTRWQRQPARA
jgi:hypothetical protein